MGVRTTVLLCIKRQTASDPVRIFVVTVRVVAGRDPLLGQPFAPFRTQPVTMLFYLQLEPNYQFHHDSHLSTTKPQAR